MVRNMSASGRGPSFSYSLALIALVEVALSSRSRPLATPVEKISFCGACCFALPPCGGGDGQQFHSDE
jgi:hypothetical protein